MANTIDNFLVGLGFKYDDKGAKKFGSSLGAIKSKALQLGAILGTSFAAKSLIFDRSEAADNMGKFADQIGVTASNVNALSGAFKLMGSDASGAMGALQAISKMQSASQQDKSGYKQAVAAQGLNPSIVTGILKAKDAYSGFIKLVEYGNTLTPVLQRRLASTLGFGKPTILMMHQGIKATKETLSLLNKMDPSINKLAKESAAFNDQWEISKMRVSAIGDSISSDILPPLTKAASMYNKLDQNHPKVTKDVVESGAGLLAVTATGAGIGVLKYFHKGEGLIGAALRGFIAPIKIAGKVAGKVAALADIPLTSAIATEVALGHAAGPKYSTDDMPGSDFRTYKSSLSSWAKAYNDKNLSHKKSSPSAEGEPKTIHVNLSLDGETIAKKVIDINNKNHTQAVHNIQSSIKG